jgi:outer membrane assembly lipoprotein YfiO
MAFIKALSTAFMILSIPMLANGPMLFSQNKQKPEFDVKDKKGHKKNPLLDKSFKELKELKDKAVQTKDLATAVKYLDAMRGVCTDPELLKDILLEMADIYFELQEWTKAERAYNEFVLLYPGAMRCDYAHYRAIVCATNLTLTPDRDQTKTEETVKLAEEFITNHPKSSYLEKVIQLTAQCREKLLESDVLIFNFYMNSKNFKAAQKRLDLICKERIAQLPTCQPLTLELSIQLAQAQNNTESVLRAQLELGQKFPDHETTKRLVNDLPNIKMQLASLEQSKALLVELPQEQTTIAQTATQKVTT